jgi:ribosome-associated toxin RatA of RatAB toxin-antitoxin module
MHAAQRTAIFDVPLDPLYEVIVDYPAYPEFVDNVTRVQMLKQDEHGGRGKFFVHVVKEFSYTLDLVHDYPRGISWTLVRSDLFKDMSGSWALKPKGKKKTEVTYTAEVHPRVIAPGFLVRQLVQHSLPKMMAAFEARAQARHAGD